ncbi:MAG: nucleotidyl transferase AbiEii/AbiGii toxin family protein [Bacteroidales bacterium]|nr:nucleotidyl transferase AbiEii/AbiGii toxin family protein [Bacteroidales bacterium]
MIPRAYITEWTQYAPWKSNEQIEQDLVICRVLTEIFSDEFLSKELAFRGGTALHKLYLHPQPRYSEDIDLVQVKEGAIGPVLDKIRELLDPLFELKAKYKKTLISNKLTYRFQSEFPPVQIMKLKIEINCREHFTELGYIKVPFEVNSKWYKGTCLINTYHLEELMGTKLRALYQRRKGRDLYDQYQALTKVTDIDINKIIQCYHSYMHLSGGASPTQELYIKNMEEKISDPEFTGDTIALTQSKENWNAEEAYRLIKTKILEKI